MSLARGLLADARRAISLLTIVPVGVSYDGRPQPGTAAWFPAAGLIPGAAGYSVMVLLRLGGWSGSAPLVVSTLVVVVWALSTRLLHWDGLADVADGLLGGHTPQRRLEIMRDSTNGSFAAVAVALVACAQVGAVASVIGAGLDPLLLVVPGVSRIAATFAAWLGHPARESGLGMSVMGRPSALHVVVAASWMALYSAGVIATLGMSAWPLVVACIVVAMGVPHVLSSPVGGVTGDIMGSSVLLTEAIALAAVAVIWGL